MTDKPTYIVVLILREERKPFLEENQKLLSHLVELTQVAVCVHVAESRADGLVNKKQVCEFVP